MGNTVKGVIGKLKKFEVRFVDVFTNEKVAESIFLHRGQIYDIPEGYEVVDTSVVKNIETVALRKVRK